MSGLRQTTEQRRKYLIILEALELGLYITDPEQGTQYAFSDDGRLGYVLEEPADRLLLLDWSLNAFMAFCDKFPNDYIMELKMNIAMNKARRASARARIAC